MLNSASFLGGLQQTTAKVQDAGKQWAASLKEPTVQALSATRESLKSTIGQAQSLAGAAVGIAGGFSAAAGAAGAMTLEDKYRELAFSVSQATGEMTKWQDVQKTIEPVADTVKRTSAEMIAAYDALMGKTTNAQFSAQALGLVGEAMNATGRSADELGTLVGTLNKKWGISDMGEVRVALMQIFEASKSIKFDELAEDLDEVGSISLSAGMTGLDGFRRSLGLAAAVAPTTNRTFSEVLTGMDQLTEKMRQMPVWQGLAKAGKFEGKKFFDDFVDQPDAFKRVEMLLTAAAKKGNLSKFLREATEVEFTGREERAAFMALAAPFIEAFEVSKDAGRSTKDATDIAVSAFSANIAKMGQTTGTWSDIQARAAENQQATSAKIRQAQEEFQRAFTDPRTMKAMGDLASKLPALAEGIATLIKFTVDNPLMAGGALLGGKAAMAGVGSLAGSAGSAMWGSVAEKFTDAVNRKKTVTEGIYDSLGMKTGERQVTVSDGGKLSNVARMAGQALGIAAAAVMAYEVGKMAIDKFMGDDLKRLNDGQSVAATGSAIAAGKDKVGQAKALEAAKSSLKELEKGPGLTESFFGGIANVVTGGEVKTAGEMNQNAIAATKRTIADLEEALTRGADGGNSAGKALERVAGVAGKAADALGKLVPPGGSNGLPPRGSTVPGFGGG